MNTEILVLFLEFVIGPPFLSNSYFSLTTVVLDVVFRQSSTILEDSVGFHQYIIVKIID